MLGKGQAYFKVLQANDQGKKIRYRCYVYKLKGPIENPKGFYAHFTSKERLEIGAHYQVKTHYTKQSPLNHQLKLLAPPQKTKVASVYCHAQQSLHQKIKGLIFSLTIPTSSQDIFLALATGELGSGQTTFLMKQFGLLHLLAISGLHFGLVASFLSFFLKRWLSPRSYITCLGFFMGLYFLFIGPSPSVIRAFTGLSLTLIAWFHYWESRPLNFLCFSLLLCLFTNPYFVFSIGFQFSYFITAGILIGFQPMKGLSSLALNRLLPSSCSYVIKSKQLLNDLFGLSLAVSLSSLPLSLFHFHSFPLASIYYNLVFPFLFSIVLYALLTSLLLYPLLPKLSLFLFSVNSYYTQGLLYLLEKAPTSHQLSLYFDLSSPIQLLVCSLSVLTFFLWLERDLHSPQMKSNLWI